MADANVDDIDEVPKKGKSGIIVGLFLALVAGGGGFAFTSGMFSSTGAATKPSPARMSESLSFIPVEPMTVAIGNPRDRRYLRFRAELEVNEDFESDIQAMMPRVVDVLNTYLQSLEMADVEDPSSLLTLRSQMRRRVDLVVGGNRVHDLLVMEFVVN
ncbi:MAG: flagellar basal body-associated FliL family protein [Pseudomonadota bacterium]